jgi:hypothetical protein
VLKHKRSFFILKVQFAALFMQMKQLLTAQIISKDMRVLVIAEIPLFSVRKRYLKYI